VSTDGVEIRLQASAGGWSAEATHAALGNTNTCALYWGDPPVRLEQLDGATPGELVCTRNR